MHIVLTLEMMTDDDANVDNIEADILAFREEIRDANGQKEMRMEMNTMVTKYFKLL